MEAVYYCTCGNRMLHDTENTLYLKCSVCDTVVIHADVVENYSEQLTVVDYGVEYIDNEEWMYVKAEDEKGNKHMYWRKREHSNCGEFVEIDERY